MTRAMKSIFMTIIYMVIVSLIFSGCYTQLSRPRVATTEVYQQPSESEDIEEYYQDEEAAPRDTRDVYIYNYYPSFGYTFYDPWYWSYYPHRWVYLGPYPDYWWSPYGPWWTPGWYVGIYHSDYYWWWGHHRYYDSYYWFGGGGSSYVPRHYAKRPFERRNLGAIGRSDQSSDSQSSLAKPATNIQPDRTRHILNPIDRSDRTTIPSPSRITRPRDDSEQQRNRSKIKPVGRPDDGKSPEPSQDKFNRRQPRVVDQPPRAPHSEPKPRVEPQKSTPKSSDHSASQPRRSSRPSEQKSNYISRPSSSGAPHISKPAAPSYTPRSSSNSGSSTTRSTPPRSSSFGTTKSSNSGNSGPSRTPRK